jgi:CO dehydrogenase/acetyl-CoA synthase alpha subunit
MNKINQIKALLGMEVKLETMKLANGTEIEAEVFEAGTEVFIVSEEEKVALPIGEYELEGGQVLVVAEEGIISEIKDAAQEEEAPVEEEVEEQEMEAEVATPKKVVESVSKETHFAKIEEMQKEIDALKLALEPKEEIVEEVKEEVELSAEEVAPIKHNPEANATKKETFLYAQKAPKTVKSTIYNKLFK